MYFFLLVLGIPFNLSPDVCHERGGFSKTLPEKGLEFVPRRGDGTVAFNLSLVLLPVELILLQKNEAAKGMRLGLVAPAVSK